MKQLSQIKALPCKTRNYGSNLWCFLLAVQRCQSY